MSNLLLRSNAENTLKSLGCAPDGYCSDGTSKVCGQFWKPPWGYGVNFFLQWFGESGLYVDEEQLAVIIAGIEQGMPKAS